MEMLTDLKRDDLRSVLGSDSMDTARDILPSFGHKLMPDLEQRTILIGVGGLGIRTIDHIKGQLVRCMDASWKNYVAFLGIDDNWMEFDGLSYLDHSEQLNITKTATAVRLSQPGTQSKVIRRFVIGEEKMRYLSAAMAFHGPRNRLIGKLRLHDRLPNSVGVDEEIVFKLSNIKSCRLQPLINAQSMCQVFIIGSLSGATGSGIIPDLPALIRNVFPNPYCLRVNAILYTPDTVAYLDPNHSGYMYANAYAALKEINYYMGMYMRPEYPETWGYNGCATQELTYATPTLEHEGFFDVVYLIGSHNGTNNQAFHTAQDTVSEFILSCVSRTTVVNGPFRQYYVAMSRYKHGIMTESWNPDSGEQIAHAFPDRYASFGCANASMPDQLIRAYTVGRVCQMAGLKPINPVERAALMATSDAALIPFRGKEDLLNALEGTAKAAKLLEPLKEVMAVIHSGDFDFSRDLNEQEITWKKIRSREYAHPVIFAKTEHYIKTQTSVEMMDELKKYISDAFRQFRINVQEYVREEGPYAFVNLYHGRFTPVDENFGMGISRMLQNLVNGKTMDGKNIFVLSVEDAKTELDSALSDILSTPNPLFGILRSVHRDQCDRWILAYNRWAKVRINKIRRETALGLHGDLHQKFLLPAAKLAEELDTFGMILEMMTEIYTSLGEPLETYEGLRTFGNRSAMVNLAALNEASYNLLKYKADMSQGEVNPHRLRDHLVDHFFSADVSGIPNSRLWLEYSQDLIRFGPQGNLLLSQRNRPAPARRIFDEIMAQEFPGGVELTIEELFTQLDQNGHNMDHTARTIISNLCAQSRPLVQAELSADIHHSFLLLPASLHDKPEGQQIALALERAVTGIFPYSSFFYSHDVTYLKMIQYELPFEIFRLNDLKFWERHYENGQVSIKVANSFLHSLSPDVTAVSDERGTESYVENLSWADYPSITVPASDPRRPDPATGAVSREGRFCQEMDKLMIRARKTGILYSEKMSYGWVIKRIDLTRIRNFQFDVHRYAEVRADSIYPEDKCLISCIEEQNGIDLEKITRVVRMEHGRSLGEPSETEKEAWEKAAVVLRYHVPMYIEVRDSMKIIQPYLDEIEAQFGN